MKVDKFIWRLIEGGGPVIKELSLSGTLVWLQDRKCRCSLACSGLCWMLLLAVGTLFLGHRVLLSHTTLSGPLFRSLKRPPYLHDTGPDGPSPGTQARRLSCPALGSLFSLATLSDRLFIYALLFHASSPSSRFLERRLFCFAARGRCSNGSPHRRRRSATPGDCYTDLIWPGLVLPGLASPSPHDENEERETKYGWLASGVTTC